MNRLILAIAMLVATFSSYGQEVFPLSGLTDKDVVIIKWKNVKRGFATDWVGKLDLEVTASIVGKDHWLTTDKSLGKMTYSLSASSEAVLKVNRELRISGKKIRESIQSAKDDEGFNIRISFLERDIFFADSYGYETVDLLDELSEQLHSFVLVDDEKHWLTKKPRTFAEASLSIQVIKSK